MDNNNGERLETYIIKGERGTGCICLNGAAARKVQVGDTVIIISYALMDFEEAKTFKPTIVFPKEGNCFIANGFSTFCFRLIRMFKLVQMFFCRYTLYVTVFVSMLCKAHYLAF